MIWNNTSLAVFQFFPIQVDKSWPYMSETAAWNRWKYGCQVTRRFSESHFGSQSEVDSTHQGDFVSWSHTSLVYSPQMGLGMGRSVKSRAGRSAVAPGHSPDSEDNVPQL